MKIWKRLLLVLLLMVAFLGGAAGQYLCPGNPTPPSDMVSMVMGVILSLAWYHLDTEQLGYRRGRWLTVSIVAIALLAFPYYFLRSRGFARGMLYSAVFLLMAVMWLALQSAGASAVYYLLRT